MNAAEMGLIAQWIHEVWWLSNLLAAPLLVTLLGVAAFAPDSLRNRLLEQQPKLAVGNVLMLDTAPPNSQTRGVISVLALALDQYLRRSARPLLAVIAIGAALLAWAGWHYQPGFISEVSALTLIYLSTMYGVKPSTRLFKEDSCGGCSGSCS